MGLFIDLTYSREQTTQVTRALVRRLRQYFEYQTPHEEHIRIQVAARIDAPAPDGRTLQCHLVFHLADGSRLDGMLLTRYLGGNMYEVDASMSDRTKRFTLCLPLPAAAGEAGSGMKIFDHLFDEVKRAAGERFLKDITRRHVPTPSLPEAAD